MPLSKEDHEKIVEKATMITGLFTGGQPIGEEGAEFLNQLLEYAGRKGADDSEIAFLSGHFATTTTMLQMEREHGQPG